MRCLILWLLKSSNLRVCSFLRQCLLSPDKDFKVTIIIMFFFYVTELQRDLCHYLYHQILNNILCLFKHKSLFCFCLTQFYIYNWETNNYVKSSCTIFRWTNHDICFRCGILTQLKNKPVAINIRISSIKSFK